MASAIYLNETVDCVEIDVANYICDYQFFYHRGVPEPILDIGATKFVEYANNMYIAFIWPTARGHEKELKEIIPNIVYEKKVILNANGAHNLLSQIYAGEKWLGNAGNNFSGVHTKLAACFETFDAIKVVAFQADNLEIVLKIKDETRALFNKGKHSIHITDTGSEAVKIAHLVLNNNSVHFLNYAKPNKYSSIYRKIAKYKSFIEKNNLSVDNMLLDGGTVLTLYGLRESSDIDYFSSESMRAKYYDDALDQHDEELIHHKKEKLELIYNPKFYFYFNGLKFISFYQLYQMKKNRSNIKDIVILPKINTQ